MRCASVRRRLERAFVRGVQPRGWPGIATHLQTCHACRELHERLWMVEDALTPGRALPRAATDRIAAALFTRDQAPKMATRARWAWVSAAMASVAAAAVVLLWFTTHALGPERGGRWSKRGGESHIALPGVRLLCVDAGHVVAAARAVEDALPSEVLRCKMTSRLQLTYSLPGVREVSMVAFSHGPSGELRWYAPTDPVEQAVRLEHDSVDRPLEWSTRLEVLHQPGPHDVNVLFFARPVVAAEAAAGRVEPIATLRVRMLLEEPLP